MWTLILCLTIETMYQAAGETEILLKRPSDGVLWSWHPTKTSHSGAGWNFLSSQTYSVCDITIPTEPTNWLRTDFIDVKDAKMLNIKLKYNLRRCPPPPEAKSFCKHKWSIYVLHVEKEVVGVDLNPVTANEVTYQKVTTIEPTDLPAHGKVEQYDYDVKIITKKGGVYLAFLDQGACVSISSVTVSYNYCPEIGSVLVRFSRTSAPVNDSYLKEQTGRCTDVNSINKVKLSGVCLRNGEWNITDGIKCLCKPGHELVIESEGNVTECSACLTGFYKSVASNSNCNECPTNSASNTGRTGCSCHEGFYKKPGLHVAPCKALPKAPRNAHLDVVKATYAKIKWERSPDDIDGLKLRYSLDCFRCNSSKYKDCKESCGPSVEYEPNKDNITNGTVTIIGLLSDSFLKFRVYSVSELNEQEKDRDKWNYVTVSTKTKAEDVPAVEGSSSKTKMVIARSAGGGGLLLLILAITIIIVVVRFKRSRRNKKEDHIMPEKASGTAKEKQDMIAELNVMKRLKPHHVLKLIGCCSISGPIQIVVGYLPYGDLLGYLRKSGRYSDSYNTGEKKSASKLTAKDHLSFAWMIADGMQYLATIKVIHRDLAARNILVGENQVCKISDFGLALDVNDDIYVRTSQARLPVKWMPPESLFHSESSTMSEVWSYGIVLWKVFTIGDSPYPGFNDTQTVSMLERGYRMQRPIHISEELFSIMSECWSEKPEERPTFKWICSADDRLIKDTKTCIDLDGYNDADYVNFDMAEGVQ